MVIILKEHCHYLTVAAKHTFAVNKVCEQFLGPVVFELNRDGIDEDLKVSEAPDGYSLIILHRVTEVFQLLPDLFRGYGLQDVARGMHIEGLSPVFSVSS